MIDVIFILLIFFAVSTTIVTNRGMKLQLPSAESIAKEKKGVIVAIDKEQRVYLNQVLIPAENLTAKVVDLVKNTPDLQIIIKADKYTPYALLIHVLDKIRLGGCFDVVLEAQKKNNYVHQRKRN